MINRIILATSIALAPLSVAHAERNPRDDLPLLTFSTAGDWRTNSGQCNFLPPPTKTDDGDILVFHPVIDFRVYLDEKGAPHIDLWNGGTFGGKAHNLRTGTLTISVDGRAFQPLQTALETNGSGVGSELPPEILDAMHVGQIARIEYQDGTPEAPLVREQSLKGFAGLPDACRALERRYDEQEARPTPDTKADVTLLCGDQTVQVWFNAGMLTWDTAAHRQVWRLDRVGAAEITFKRLGRYGTDLTVGLVKSGPAFADLDGQIDRVSGAFSRSDGSHGTCAPAAAKF